MRSTEVSSSTCATGSMSDDGASFPRFVRHASCALGAVAGLASAGRFADAEHEQRAKQRAGRGQEEEGWIA